MKKIPDFQKKTQLNHRKILNFMVLLETFSYLFIYLFLILCQVILIKYPYFTSIFLFY